MFPKHRVLSRVSLFALVLFAATSLSAQMAVVPGPLRVAIVGLEHGHVDGFLNALRQNYFNEVQLVAVSDPDSALLAKYQKKFGWPDYLLFHSEAEMIEKIKPQAILVYTPVGGHRPAIEIAAQHGVSVMVEKPLTISLSDARAIRATAEAHHIQVLVNYETTWYASNRAAYEEAQRGSIGAIRRIVVHDGHQGPAEIGVQPEFLKWLTDPAQNGAGAMYDFGCYGADLATWLMHGQAPLTVTAVANHDKPERYPRVDDDATIVLQYPGAQVVIQASWNWPFSRKDMEVYGATGYAITVERDRLRTRHEHDSAEQVRDASPLPAMEKDSISYLSAVLNGKIVPRGDLSSLDTNMVVMQILDAARESVRTGKTIRLTETP
jgi:glucose-fructose oxidoreductase